MFLENTPDETTAHESSDEESFVDRVDYHELDQFDHWRELTKTQQYDVIILDVGSTIGNDLYLSALSIATEFIHANQQQPRAIIVKSKVLNNLARRIFHSQRLLDGTLTLPTKGELKECPDPIVIPCIYTKFLL